MSNKRVFKPPFPLEENEIGEVFVKFDEHGIPYIDYAYKYDPTKELPEPDMGYTSNNLTSI